MFRNLTSTCVEFAVVPSLTLNTIGSSGTTGTTGTKSPTNVCTATGTSLMSTSVPVNSNGGFLFSSNKPPIVDNV